MKSLLQEAPSVERAISQAWEAAGRPQEFSVKIHDHGKRGFLGFSSSPAVVSITYKPLGGSATPASAAQKNKPSHGRSHRDGETSRSDDRRAPREDRNGSQERGEQQTGLLGGDGRSERRSRSEREDRGRRDRRSSDRSPRSEQGEKPRGLLSYAEGEAEGKKDLLSDIGRSTQEVFRKSSIMQESNSDDSSFGDVWDDAFVASVIAWLKEIMSTMGYAIPFESHVSGKVLHVDFAEDFLSDSELSRSLYASLSFILLQFLKREHKRRFRGLRIVLSHPGHDVSRIIAES